MGFDFRDGCEIENEMAHFEIENVWILPENVNVSAVNCEGIACERV